MSWPMNVAAMAPAMPRIAVSQKPDGPAPGVIALAISPATKPITMVQTQCIISISPKFNLPVCNSTGKLSHYDAPFQNDDPDKGWKASLADFQERKYWDEYRSAYEDMLTRCSTEYAPWFIIPSNKKWFRNLAVSHVISETLEDMKMKFPAPTIDVKRLKWK